MPLYLTRFRYTPETWAMLIAEPEDRRRAATAYIESVGGSLHGFWYAFGEWDGFTLWEAPDDVAMAAVALAIGGGGALGNPCSAEGSALVSAVVTPSNSSRNFCSGSYAGSVSVAGRRRS